MRISTTIVIGMISQSAFTAGIGINPATGIDMGNNKITDLAAPELYSDAVTKAYVDDAAAPEGFSSGDMQYWDGTAWVLIQAPGDNAKMLSFCAGVPYWTDLGCLAIGDTGPAGGIVFYITDGGAHGLEAALADQGINAEWGCYGTLIAGADGTTVGTGAQNTADIVAGCDSSPDNAAEITDAYELNGYSDWFLPSRDELNLLYQQKDVVGGFTNGAYWSSTEYGINEALDQGFFDGSQGTGDKNFTLGVRAVRAF